MKAYSLALVLAGAAATAVIAFGAVFANGRTLVADISHSAEAARDEAGGTGIALSFATRQGWLTRHPRLSGGDRLDDDIRARTAAAISNVPGVGGIVWQTSGARTRAYAARGPQNSLHCQSDVEAVLKARTIRFSEASASIDPASLGVLDEVASVLRPCVGGIIAVTGHSNNSGDEGANVALSKARADAVRWSLIGRGIPADGLRTAGMGSQKPVEGLDPDDAANRRIDFSVIEKVRVNPTPIDTPGPG